MRNHTTIRLSADAMERLFPEGAEARIELQQAILQEVANRHVKVAIDEQLSRLCAQLAKEVIAKTDVAKIVAESFTRHYGWGKEPFTVREDSEMSAAIGARLTAQLRQQQGELIEALAEKAVAAAHDGLMQRVDDVIQRKTSTLERTLVHSRLNAALQAAYTVLGADAPGSGSHDT